jgi:hypothetical protein
MEHSVAGFTTANFDVQMGHRKNTKTLPVPLRTFLLSRYQTFTKPLSANNPTT